MVSFLHFVILSIYVLQLFKARQVHTGIWQMEENSQSHRDVWHVFILGWGDPHQCKPCVVPQGVLTPLYIKCKQSLQDPHRLYNREWFCAVEPILKVIWILLSHSFPDIWVSEPDWLHFPYSMVWDMDPSYLFINDLWWSQQHFVFAYFCKVNTQRIY